MTPSERIDIMIDELPDWRGRTLAAVRAAIFETDPGIIEEWKWMGSPVWSLDGIIAVGDAHKAKVKLTFAHGAAALADPDKVFNASLDGGTRRAIDYLEGDKIDAPALQKLVRAAIAFNRDKPKKAKGAKASSEKVVLLSGGNPQIAKGDGDGPVQAYIAAMPGWKSELGRRLDALIVRTVPDVRKAVRWNSPFYGVEGQGWFVSFHVLTRYVKVTFFNGAALEPPPPGFTPKSGQSRWIDIYEDDGLDEAQMASWVKQAASIPGWIP